MQLLPRHSILRDPHFLFFKWIANVTSTHPPNPHRFPTNASAAFYVLSQNKTGVRLAFHDMVWQVNLQCGSIISCPLHVSIWDLRAGMWKTGTFGTNILDILFLNMWTEMRRVNVWGVEICVCVCDAWCWVRGSGDVLEQTSFVKMCEISAQLSDQEKTLPLQDHCTSVFFFFFFFFFLIFASLLNWMSFWENR
jgi:hypothetical protein